jgi:Leucine-rich repeat (LRR) protein
MRLFVLYFQKFAQQYKWIINTKKDIQTYLSYFRISIRSSPRLNNYVLPRAVPRLFYLENILAVFINTSAAYSQVNHFY